MNSNTELNISQQEANRRLGVDLGCKIYGFYAYSDGFSFQVDTELDAYKCAHKYQGRRTTVKHSPNIQMWTVSVYGKIQLCSMPD